MSFFSSLLNGFASVGNALNSARSVYQSIAPNDPVNSGHYAVSQANPRPVRVIRPIADVPRLVTPGKAFDDPDLSRSARLSRAGQMSFDDNLDVYLRTVGAMMPSLVTEQRLQRNMDNLKSTRNYSKQEKTNA
jgi:hypothetical protein